MVDPKICDVTTWETNNFISHIAHISRSEGNNQTMKFGQLTEYNMRNIFLEKSYTKCGGETIPGAFSKKSKLTVSLDQFVLIVCQGLSKYIEIKPQTTWFYLI